MNRYWELRWEWQKIMLKWRQEATTKQNKQTKKNSKHPETQITLIYSCFSRHNLPKFLLIPPKLKNNFLSTQRLFTTLDLKGFSQFGKTWSKAWTTFRTFLFCRLHLLEKTLEHWDGPVSAAININQSVLENITTMVKRFPLLMERRKVELHLMYQVGVSSCRSRISSGVCSFSWILPIFHRAGFHMLWEKQSRRAKICTQISKTSTPLGGSIRISPIEIDKASFTHTIMVKCEFTGYSPMTGKASVFPYFCSNLVKLLEFLRAGPFWSF